MSSTIAVSVKTLSGEMISLALQPTITRRQFYTRVYAELPEEVQPEEEYQMTLLREPKGEEEGEELPWDTNRLDPEEGETFYVVIGTEEYDLKLQSNWVDVYEATRAENNLFCLYDFYLYKNGVMIHDECFYHNEDENRLYGSERVETNWVGRHSDELVITLPQDVESWESMEEGSPILMRRVPNHSSVRESEHQKIPRRVLDYLGEELNRQWREMMEYRRSEEEEEQEEEQEEQEEQEHEDDWA